ncbi:hypothetical protein ONZ45_g8206 [Pleurotus djamor]|nr:hypothetical protein ONZ45_g8206 [Pleurotus djamor]
MFNPGFSVAGMPPTTGGNAHANWNGSPASGLSDSLSQSRLYQSGYLISTTPNNNSPQGNQRADEAPVVQTKAKLNNGLSRGPASDFGMSAMFENSRKRQTIADEDAPPTASVNDLPTELHFDSPSRFRQSQATELSFSRRHAPTPSSSNAADPTYIIVFGYPPEKFGQTVEYFKALGSSTEPQPHNDISNCFRIGYNDPGDALRAVRKNGETLGGSWMVGAKWADPTQAELMLGQSVFNRGAIMAAPVAAEQNASNAMAVDHVPSQHTPASGSSPSVSVGTPLKLAPSSSAFRRPGSGGSTPSVFNTPAKTAPIQQSPSKGMLGQVSDLIFGW